MLIFDFRFMQLRFALGHRCLRLFARRSLGECARILIRLARSMGDRGVPVLRANLASGYTPFAFGGAAAQPDSRRLHQGVSVAGL